MENGWTVRKSMDIPLGNVGAQTIYDPFRSQSFRVFGNYISPVSIWLGSQCNDIFFTY